MIWGQKWLPSPISHCVQSPVQVLTADARVAELIDEERKEWKVDLIARVFNKEEADMICAIPISCFGAADRRFWGFSKTGKITVKSAYHADVQWKIERKGCSSKGNRYADQWKKVWSMEVPGGYKHFVWNALNNALPTRINLFKRKVIEDSICPVCKREEEDVKHALWCCPAAADVWAEAESLVRKWRNQVQDFTSLWMELIKRLSKGCLERVVAIMRGIWGRRNAFLFENKFGSTGKVVRLALVCLEEYQ
ncbi:hypothetical protein F2P56_006963 [Juglans regia]|uniref:Uncharacterized protein LOC108983262 n=2 Tax=Juglans regia TaxID=51240 RepID=A0A2I4DTB8_JUGRE|nr:uncharacterized protein LOC108983262 [Juglans regia]KAF5475122.1 hypothetical protein F2P56_006963 [Juglans regia]